MKKIRTLVGLRSFSLIAVLFFYTASTCISVAQEAGDCTQEEAVQAARANPVVASFCTNSVYGKRDGCEFKARTSSPLPLNEKNDPGPGWLVTASTSEGSIFAKVSKACKVTNHPFFVKTVELGSLELGVLESVDVVVGKVVDVKSPEPVHVNGGTKLQTETVTVEVSKILKGEFDLAPDVPSDHTHVTVSKVLKGEQTSKVTFDESFTDTEHSAKQWIGTGHEMLFFISRGSLAGSTCTGPRFTEEIVPV